MRNAKASLGLEGWKSSERRRMDVGTPPNWFHPLRRLTGSFADELFVSGVLAHRIRVAKLLPRFDKEGAEEENVDDKDDDGGQTGCTLAACARCRRGRPSRLGKLVTTGLPRHLVFFANCSAADICANTLVSPLLLRLLYHPLLPRM